MSESNKINVVFVWHMHQPEYRNLQSGEYQLPWTYLHAIRDYVDMAWHLENCPKMRAVVNFTPILLEQIEDYASQCANWLELGTETRDPMLRALTMAVMPANIRERTQLIEACLRVNESRIIERFAPFHRLAHMARSVIDDHASVEYLSNQYLVDLVTWYHLGWLGESVRKTNPHVAHLVEKGGGYSLHDRRLLVELMSELMGELIGRYRNLHGRGQIELSCSAYAHPMLPLLISFASAKEAIPDMHLPLLDQYPGGADRAREQVKRGQEVFNRHFGFDPQGVWPSEGGISDAAISLLGEVGVTWCASGQSVLNNTLGSGGPIDDHQWLYRGYRHEQSGVNIFFRNDELSDAIGFTYSNWPAKDAVGDLISRLERIALQPDASDRIVSIIMDGENAWEYYPENAWDFLSKLYEELTTNEHFNITTYSDYLAAHGPGRQLPPIVAGSWVYGTFSTWIGMQEKCRAWDVLGDVKRTYDAVIAGNELDEVQRAKVDRQLAICEGSDWFWWLGDYNPREAVSDFERLFRIHVSNLYVLMKREPPDYLSQRLAHGGGHAPHGGVMRQGGKPVDSGS